MALAPGARRRSVRSAGSTERRGVRAWPSPRSSCCGPPRWCCSSTSWASSSPATVPTLGSYWYLVAGLAAYNGSVIAEIFRAGIVSLGAGQREAGLAIGLTEGQVLRRILFPQGVRRMMPALVNQLVTLLKDSSLGALVLLPAVEDLLHQGRIVGEFEKSPLQALMVTAVMYIIVNFTLSSVAAWLERRQSRRFGGDRRSCRAWAAGRAAATSPWWRRRSTREALGRPPSPRSVLDDVPPSTFQAWPVTQLPWSEHRYTTVSAMSSPRAGPASGTCVGDRLLPGLAAADVVHARTCR